MEYDERSAQVMNFISGLVLGAVIGAGVALLTAPETGRRTRRKLARVATDARGSASDRWEDLADDVKGRVDEAVQGARKRFGR